MINKNNQCFLQCVYLNWNLVYSIRWRENTPKQLKSAWHQCVFYENLLATMVQRLTAGCCENHFRLWCRVY